jgi:predicted SPOUT superfamily RNA methylase MTH1
MLNISIAIPDSCLSDETTQLEKTRKISIFARSSAIFSVDTIFIYNDGGSKEDRSLLVTILKYLDTPPFLRRRLFPKLNELKYAGVLHPLKIPSHVSTANPKKIKEGDVREGIVISTRGKKFVDAGINRLIPYYGSEKIGKRITIKFKKITPEFSIKEIARNEVQEYWGYIVKERTVLGDFLSTWKDKIILTSRKGKPIKNSQIKEYNNSKESILIVFGSIEKGIYEILGSKLKKMQNAKVINFFPHQATETVRLEEAILGTLSILNSE